MNILLVEPSIKRLRSIALLMQAVSPDSLVMSTADPLMAAKYAFSNTVDVLFAELNMKRMSGLKLSEFVRDKSPDAQTFLIASREELADCPESFDCGVHPLALPITEESLRRAFTG